MQPRARRAIVEAAAEREHHVSVACGFVRGVRAVAPDRPQRQLVGLVDHALAVGTRHDWNAQHVDEVEYRRAGLTDEPALSDENDRTLGAQQ